MNEEISSITNKGKMANGDCVFLQTLYSVYKKIRAILFTYLLTYLNKDAPVLLKVINNIWTN